MTNSWEQQRDWMVAQQLKARGISDPAVLEAFRSVPRHLFVPRRFRANSYQDGPLPIAQGQTISQPYMVAVMLQLARIDSSSRVLEIGTGSGYQTALLCCMTPLVFSVERLAELAESAAETLQTLGLEHARIRVGDGTLGWPEEAPFDAILVSAGGLQAPPPLLDQLTIGGRLVIPLQRGDCQLLFVITRTPSGYEEACKDACSFVPLIGTHGWQQS